jgi:hypothetical protein
MRDPVFISFVVAVTAALLACAAASGASPGCSIKFVYPSSPFTIDNQVSPVLFVKSTHNESINFVLKYSGSIPESAATGSAFAIFEIFSGGAQRSPLRWQAKFPFSFKTSALLLDHVTYISVPTDALLSDTYATVAAAVFFSTSNSSSTEDSEL